MNVPKIILIIGIVVLILVGVAFIYVQSNGHDGAVPQMNNTTNITKNVTLNSTVTNNTTTAAVVNDDDSNSEASSSSSESYSDSESYVERWDRSQQDEDSWAFTHDQPVTTDDEGNSYVRVYSEDTGQSSWESMEPKSN